MDQRTSYLGTIKKGITKRVYIPKANGKWIPLGIPAFYDRIVQEAVVLSFKLYMNLFLCCFC